MDTAMQWVLDKYNNGLHDTWAWFNNLNRDEWLIVLTVVCVMGFLCLRGHSSRAH